MNDLIDFPHEDGEPPEILEPETNPETPVQIGELHNIIDEMTVAIQEAKALPLSGAVRVEREEFLAMLEQLRAILPDELRAARWMVRERSLYRPNQREGESDHGSHRDSGKGVGQRVQHHRRSSRRGERVDPPGRG